MARVAIFIGVLSAPIPPRSISSLTVTIADPGEIQEQIFPGSTISVTERVGLTRIMPKTKGYCSCNLYFLIPPLKMLSVSAMWQWYLPLVTTACVSSWCLPITQAAPSTSLGPCRPFIKRSELSSILSFLHILSVQRSETFYGREIRHKLDRPAKPRYALTATLNIVQCISACHI